MGVSPQSLERARGRVSDRSGFALPTVVFAMVVILLLIVGAFTLADLDAKSSRNRQASARAMLVAEAGLEHALALGRGLLAGQSMGRLLIGSDNSAGGTADNGVLDGYGLSADDAIPAAGRAFGGGTYFVQVLDDPADPVANLLLDGNNQVLLRCRSTMPDGGAAEVNVIVRTIRLPGIAVDGNLEISSAAVISGACGGIHTNGNLSGGGHPTVGTVGSATGTVTLDVSPKQSGAPPLDIPEMDPAAFCPPGGIPKVAGTWTPSSANLVAGNTYCVTGNVDLSVAFGSMGSMRAVSIIASGSIKVPDKPFMRAAHPDGIVLLAGGDIDIQGDAGFQGVVYGGGQCYLSSKPKIIGQLICKNKSPHPGANWVPANLISGDVDITYNCGGMFDQRFRIVAWYPTVGL